MTLRSGVSIKERDRAEEAGLGPSMTSKIDNPPPYEDALHHPKYEPTQLQQGSADPLPPSYSPGPDMYAGPPSYWGTAGIWAAPGISPSAMATTIPTLSAGMPATNPREMEGFLSTQWESTSVRHAFIRKVYLILAAQLTVTFSVVAVFTFVEPVKMFVIKYPGIYWASLVVYFMVYCILICCKEPRYPAPENQELVNEFGCKHAFMTMSVSRRRFPWNLVLLAVFVDFTSCGGFLCIAAILLVIIGTVTAIVLSFHYVPWLHMLYAAVGAIIYTLFLVYNTQLLIGNRELALSPEEYVYGALSLYIDIVHIFLFMLQIGGSATE
ncbi:protein lifeguard 3-like isoform X4 [Hippocampus zosterae]|uniref:protein lifeguard 3-like isoform X4 n=1 Tax=Hippocampus zosterae TaxID=109293 RepID=UPI00223D6E15|nr:protein lifeguard 3-like isoform X4 [Hippocampus zosterae]